MSVARAVWLITVLTLSVALTALADQMLTVQSSPASGVSITGSYPGATSYSAATAEGTPITLTAPVRSGELSFKQWSDTAGVQLSTSRTMSFSFEAAAATASQLYAGTAKVDITPDQAVVSTGEGFRLPDDLPDDPVPPDNVHDPLYARVIVLKNDETSVAIVTVDAILFSSEWVVDQAKTLYSLDHVILMATHDHSAMMPVEMSPTGLGQWWSFEMADPGVTMDWPGFSSDPWWAATEQKIVTAIGEANDNLFPARVASGQAPFESYYVTHNRRHLNSDGSVSMWWGNSARLPTSPVDHTLRVVRVEDETGNPRALLVHYACHPVIMMGDAMITADFPGAMVDYIEGELGEDCMAMYLQGAEGDIDTYELSLRDDYGFNYVQAAGADLGQGALDLSASISSPTDPSTSLHIKEDMLTINYREPYPDPNNPGEFIATSEACLATVLINNDLAMLTIPGEIFCQHQLNLAEQSPISNTFILGISYCGQGSPYMIYIPTAQAVWEGGYGATTCSYVEAEAGDKMIRQGLASIRSFVGDMTVVAEYEAVPYILYVNDDATGEVGSVCTVVGNDANDGLSPDTPMRTIQALLDKYPDWGEGKTVWVDPGTYVENVSIGAGHAGMTLQGAGQDSTIVDGNDAGACLSLASFIEGTVSGFTFRNGTANIGGGMHVLSSSATVADCTFSDNSAGTSSSGGGGMYCADSPLTVTDCTFSGNSAGLGHGGGIYVYNCSPTITGCTFTDNSAQNYGGGIYTGRSCSPTISDCVFNGNSAQFGGAIINHNSSATVTGCTFINNVVPTSGAGGGIHNYDAPSVVVTDCVFFGNTGGWGGGFYSEADSDCTTTNSTFVGNGATYYGGGMCVDNATLTVTNCILWNNTAASGLQLAFNSANQSVLTTMTVSYSDVQGGQAGVLLAQASQDTLNWGAANINVDPLFVSGSDVHLQTDSPCIDSADGSVAAEVDRDGNLRQDHPGMPNVGNGPPWADMGAYEFQYYLPPYTFYVNDTYNAAEEVYCTAAGDSANSGISPDSPMSSLQEVLAAYVLGPGYTIYVDTGTYIVASSIVIGAEDAGVTVIGSTHANGSNLSATSPLDAAAIIQVDSADGVELHNLKIFGGWVGVQCLDAAGLELVKLTCRNSGWAGILLDGCDESSVRCATLDTNGFSGIHVCNCSDTTVENTLVCGTPCGIFADASPSTTVCNATLYRNGWGVWFGNGSTSGQVKNSIIATIRKRSYYGLYLEDPSQSGFQSDCNDHYVTGYANVGYWSGNKQNLGVWQTATEGDVSSLSADPLLADPDNVDAASRDYCLATGSPCIDAGDLTVAPSCDIADVTRDTHPDIGAYEVPSESESPPVNVEGKPEIMDVTSDAAMTDDGLPNSSSGVTTTWKE